MRPLLAIALTLSAALATATSATLPGRAATGANCTAASTGMTPLPDLGKARYNGFAGGLYPGGRVTPSAAYLKKGRAWTRLVKPVGGKIVLLSIGMSNTTQEFSAFKRLADADLRKNPSLVIVDGAQGGQDAPRIKDGSAQFWSVIDQRLASARAQRNQVQVAWVKEAIAGERRPFPSDARGLQADLRQIVAVLRSRFPNLRLVYLSSRTYAGYATTPLNPEPYAYQSGFAVKWLVTERIEGRLPRRPWLGWGPYLWTDGTKGRRDGFVWTCSDTAADGTHPSASGREKVGALLLSFFKRTRPRAPGSSPAGERGPDFELAMGGTGLEPVTPSLSSWCSPN